MIPISKGRIVTMEKAEHIGDYWDYYSMTVPDR
uniref:Uncharacterized protein n=1 Tax=Candidatus Kentrum sp. FW TaxID=2126338 RepID=A0A450U0M6_9GAMM|nr:MAG: hypothetical protein BECKFW1821C_GA0114237_109113 [Candidatus Kentron sp. FW]